MEQSKNHQFCVVLVTAPSRAQAAAIAKTLVELKLAACVNLLPICSIYTWQGDLQTEEEWQLLIKSELSKFVELEAKLRAIHPYEVPEIIALPILAGSQPYLQWIADHVNPA
ncbi:MAG: divalent-cation tolerance protein CutA [Oscillatoriales cyanobacterium C42_A2020_001]|nr:divalent-cation tolerance protein CutA [Leptolyngbyaceae cyanobacterium C42_A2020_001]